MPPTTSIGAEKERKQWTEGELALELRRLHARGVRITSKDLLAAGEAKVLGAIARVAGSIDRARELAELPELVVRRPKSFAHWSTARVLQEIRRRHIGGQPLATSRVPPNLRDAAITWFGSWQRAIEQAGLDYTAIRLKAPERTKRQVGKELRTLARTEPTMTRARLRRHDVGAAAIRRYGSLEAALEAAGVVDWPRRGRAKRVSPKWTVERLTADLRARHKAGKSMAPETLLREEPALYRAIRRKLGAVGAAIAKIVPETEDLEIRDERRVLAMIRLRQRKGLSLEKVDVPPRLRSAARRLFGTWQNALTSAGVDVDEELSHRTWTEDDLLAALRALAAEKPATTVSELHRSRLGSTATTRFGSLATALRLAGLTRWPRRLHRRLPERDDVVRLLQQRHARGDALTMEATRRHEPRLLKAAIKHFGKWSAALAAAGLAATGSAT